MAEKHEEFYGLKEAPFAITPDPRFFYESKQHAGALVRIQHAIDGSRGLTVVIGDIGVGKTFVSRKLLEILEQNLDKYEPSLFVVIHHEITAAWLVKKLAIQLGCEKPAEDKTTLISQICRRLTDIDRQNKKAVILIDEAHMFQTIEIYEELRGLMNVESNDRKLLNIVLFGPPELDKYMGLDPPLVSRIGLKFNLTPLDEASTGGLIKHRLKIAGCENEIFSAETVKVIHEYTSGIPRLINGVCENCLFEGFLAKQKSISPAAVEKAALDLGLSKSKDIVAKRSQPIADKKEETAEQEKAEKTSEQKEKRSSISFV